MNELDDITTEQELQIVLRGASYEEMLKTLKVWLDEQVYILSLPNGIAASNNKRPPYSLKLSKVD